MIVNRRACGLIRETGTTTDPPSLSAPRPRSDGRLAERARLRHQQVHDLRTAGKSINAIVRELGLARETVRRYLRADQVDDLLTQAATSNRPSKIDPWIDHLRQRWNEGCTLITVLHQEIRALATPADTGLCGTGYAPGNTKNHRRRTPRNPSRTGRSSHGSCNTRTRSPPTSTPCSPRSARTART
ncbi:helix-turn-helix domain-containing protein [Actinoplanes sp. HUAS TT8]|uniref:helix-turn-helix domain-containing protein n=1 Tax=Actinoplanes sp. HUAS TT8 TaxID=3447453 RepID=UPI003F51AD00